MTKPVTLMLTDAQVSALRAVLSTAATDLHCDIAEHRKLPGLSGYLSDLQSTIADVLEQLPKGRS